MAAVRGWGSAGLGGEGKMRRTLAAPVALRTRSRRAGSPSEAARGLEAQRSQTADSRLPSWTMVTVSPTSGVRVQTEQRDASSMPTDFGTGRGAPAGAARRCA